MRFTHAVCTCLVTAAFIGATNTSTFAQRAETPKAPAGTASSDTSSSSLSEVPADYRIGPGDVLTVSFWRRPDMSTDVVVRPDGKISLMLLDDVQASGLTPEQLRDGVLEKANKYLEDARVTIFVKEINSRNVYITGLVAKPGLYHLRGRLTVVQLLAMAGGLLEFANANRIAIMREEKGRDVGYKFNYDEVMNLRHLDQNIELKPGDTVIVP